MQKPNGKAKTVALQARKHSVSVQILSQTELWCLQGHSLRVQVPRGFSSLDFIPNIGSNLKMSGGILL